MPAPISVSLSPVRISSRVTKPYLITNNSTTVAVYLGQDPNISANNYSIILNAGQSLTWNEINSDVWAITASGSAVVSIAYEASATFSSNVNIANASIPISGTVNANITNASIPVTGNVGITSGSVSITSGSVAVSSGNVAAAVGNTPTLLTTATINYTSASPLTDTFFTDVDISAYASVIVQVSVSATSSPTGNLSISNGAYLEYSGIQSNTQLTPQSTTTWQRTNDAIFTFGDGVGSNGGSGTVLLNAIQTYQFQVRNKWLTSSWFRYATGSATGATGIITVRVYGSYETIDRERYTNIPGASRFPTGGAMYQFGTQTAPYNTTATAPSINGDAMVAIGGLTVTTLTAVLYTVYYFDGSTNQILSRNVVSNVSTGNAGLVTKVTLPNAPISYQLVLSGVGTGYMTVTQNR